MKTERLNVRQMNRPPGNEGQARLEFDPARDISLDDWERGQEALERLQEDELVGGRVASRLALAAHMNCIDATKVFLSKENLERARDAIFPTRGTFSISEAEAACSVRQLGLPSPLTSEEEQLLFGSFAVLAGTDDYYSCLPEAFVKSDLLDIPRPALSVTDIEKLKETLEVVRSQVDSKGNTSVLEYLYYLKILGVPGFRPTTKEWKKMHEWHAQHAAEQMVSHLAEPTIAFFNNAQRMTVLAAEEVKIVNGRIVIKMRKSSEREREPEVPPLPATSHISP